MTMRRSAAQAVRHIAVSAADGTCPHDRACVIAQDENHTPSLRQRRNRCHVSSKPSIRDAVNREEALASLIADLQDRMNGGESIDQAEILRDHPEFRAEIEDFFRSCVAFEDAFRPTRTELLPLEEEETRLDLEQFRIRRRLDDHILGTVHLLAPTPHGVPREMIVARGWFTPAERQRMERAAQFASGFENPGAARILDVGRLNQVPFVIREHAVGASVDALIRTLTDAPEIETAHESWCAWKQLLGASCSSPNSDPLVRRRRAQELAGSKKHRKSVLALVYGWAGTLASAHEEGFLHRGLSSENLSVTNSGRPLIQDFGLVWSGIHIAPKRLEKSSLDHLAPEVVAADHRPVSWLTDVWGLAAVTAKFLTLLSRQDVIRGAAEQRRTFVDYLLSEIPRSLPSSMQALLADALSGSLERRPSSIEDFVAELAAASGVASTTEFDG